MREMQPGASCALWNCAALRLPGWKRLNFSSRKHRKVCGGGREAHTSWRGFARSLDETLRIWFHVSYFSLRSVRINRSCSDGESGGKKWWKSCNCDPVCACVCVRGSGGWGRTGRSKVSDLKWHVRVRTEIMWLAFSSNHSVISTNFHFAFSHSGFIILSFFSCTKELQGLNETAGLLWAHGANGMITDRDGASLLLSCEL